MSKVAPHTAAEGGIAPRGSEIEGMKRCEMCGKITSNTVTDDDGTVMYQCADCAKMGLDADSRSESIDVKSKGDFSSAGAKGAVGRTPSFANQKRQGSDTSDAGGSVTGAAVEEEEEEEAPPSGVLDRLCCCFRKSQQKGKILRKTRFHGVVVSMYAQTADRGSSDKTIMIIKNTRRISNGQSMEATANGNDPFESERSISCWDFWPVICACVK